MTPQEAAVTPEIRDLLAAIEDALERGPDLQRFRVTSAIHDLLREGSTATPAWAAAFIRKQTATSPKRPS